MTRLATVFGGSGFFGRYIVQHLARAGWRVRVAVRRPNEALFVKTYGVVGQIEPVFANIRDDLSVAEALAGADSVFNCVGTFDVRWANCFEAVNVEGAARIARLAKEAEVGAFVHISALGASTKAPSRYAQTKAQGEARIKAAFPGVVILRPSVIFGAEDNFFNRFAAIARLAPVLPVVGGKTQFQPVYVDDVAAAAVFAVHEAVKPGIYELGGPEVASFQALMQRMLHIIRRRRLIFDLPFSMARLIAQGFDIAEILTVGLFKNSILTKDQVVSLQSDNCLGNDYPGLAALGVENPVALDTVLEEYLWRYRPQGQYNAIKASAKNLRR